MNDTFKKKNVAIYINIIRFKFIYIHHISESRFDFFDLNDCILVARSNGVVQQCGHNANHTHGGHDPRGQNERNQSAHHRAIHFGVLGDNVLQRSLARRGFFRRNCHFK